MSRTMPTECAFCTDGLFVTYGPDSRERGLCRDHAQKLAIDYANLVARLLNAKNALEFPHTTQAPEGGDGD